MVCARPAVGGALAGLSLGGETQIPPVLGLTAGMGMWGWR